MTIYDISLTISPTLPTWPGDPALELEQIESMDRGAHANVTRISAAVHLGTHVDAPHHFLNDGRTVEGLPLDILTGQCYVTQLPDAIEAITAEVLDRTEITSEMKRVLFGTRNSHLWARGESKFQTDFVAITGSGYLTALTNAVACVTNSGVWITNVSAAKAANGTMNVTFAIAGGSNAVVYVCVRDLGAKIAHE